MDFSKMRVKLGEGAYRHWDDLLADLDLIFSNCMTFNPPATFYHLEAQKQQQLQCTCGRVGVGWRDGGGVAAYLPSLLPYPWRVHAGTYGVGRTEQDGVVAGDDLSGWTRLGTAGLGTAGLDAAGLLGTAGLGTAGLDAAELLGTAGLGTAGLDAAG
eukprot:351552-Chlamydomonas_euryale.AAC.1